MLRKHRGELAGLAIACALIACTPDDPLTPRSTVPPAPEQPQLLVVDGKNGGADAFRWLPPFSADADYTGTNDDAAAPVVEICVQGGAECAVFATSGANLPAPVVVPAKKDEGAHFALTWKTSLYSLDPAKTYRVVVRRAGLQQGFADVDVVPTQADLATVPQGVVGVVVGETMTIRFRIVRGIQRTWVGGATTKGKNADPVSATEWANAANWSPAGAPFRLDTVLIAAAANKPVLAANTSVGGITVMDGATLEMGPFDLTVTSDVAVAATGAMNATTGRVILAGVAKTIAGWVPRLVVTGSYSLAGNVTTTANARINGGRLRIGGFRFRVVQSN